MWKTLTIGGIVLSFIAMAGVARMGSAPASEIHMEQVSVREIAKTVMASGYVNYSRNITLRTEVTGQIQQILVEEGQQVGAGDPLLIIDPTSFQAAVNQFRAKYEMAKISIIRQQVLVDKLIVELERKRKLYDSNVLGKDTFENIEMNTALAKVDIKSRNSELEQARASYEQALDKLKKTVIRAPIDGIVTGLNAKIGETVVEGRSTMVGTSLMNVSDPSEIIAEVYVEEAGILAIKIGQSANVTTAADPGGIEKAIVVHIGTTARRTNNNNNSFLVKLHLKDSNPYVVRLGLSCRAEIITDKVSGAVNVPVEAILYENNKARQPYIFIARNDVAIKKKIDTGLQNDSRAEIKTGLKEGEILITGPYRLLKSLREGQKLNNE